MQGRLDRLSELRPRGAVIAAVEAMWRLVPASRPARRLLAALGPDALGRIKSTQGVGNARESYSAELDAGQEPCSHCVAVVGAWRAGCSALVMSPV